MSGLWGRFRMGTVINAGDIAPSSEGINFKEIKEVLNLVNNIVGKVRGGSEPAPQLPRGSPRRIQQDKNPPPQPEIKNVQIDQGQLKILIHDLIYTHSLKIPEEIKDMKVGDVIGENFDNLKVKHMGIPVSPENIIDAIVDNTAKSVNRMIIPK